MTETSMPIVTDPEEVPLRYFRRPQRDGVEGRYETGDGFARILHEDDALMVGISETLPGESFQVDLHPDHEFLYIIQGELTLLSPVRGEAVRVKQGQFVHNLPNTQHQTINLGTEVLKVLFFTPASGEDGVGGVH